MNRERKFRKAFTLVELVVVIAIVAILSAVSVVSYFLLTQKAQLSADQQAVTEMNTVLQVNEVQDGKNSNVNEVIAELSASNMNVVDYVPLIKDNYFYWDAEINRILIVNTNDEVIYPQEFVNNNGVKYESGRWESLSGKIPSSDNWKSDSASSVVSGVYTQVAIENGKEMYSFMTELSKNSKIVSQDTKIVFQSADIDMMGTSWFAENVFGSVITGITGGTTIRNMAIRDSAIKQNNVDVVTSDKPVDYQKGFISEVKTGETVEISNITFDGVAIDTPEDPYSNSRINGVVIGSINGGSVKLKNVHVKNSTVRGYQKVGGFVGYVAKGSLTMENCTIENSQITTYATEAGGLVGYIHKDATTNFSEVEVKNSVQVTFDKSSYSSSDREEGTVKTYTNKTIIGKDKDGQSYSYKLNGDYTCYYYPSLDKNIIYGVVSKYYFLSGNQLELDSFEPGSQEKYVLNGSYPIDDLTRVEASLPQLKAA